MTTLQLIWFVLIGVLLAGYVVLDGFDLGVGFWHLFVRKNGERGILLKAIGPFWDGNEVWLLTGGGAIFAAFPPMYATVFSGFYLAMMLVVFALIFRAVGIEYRNKVEGRRWQAFWDRGFAFGSIVPALLYGVALGNVIRGLPLDVDGNYMGSFFALLNPYALLVGVTGLMLFAGHGARFLAMKTEGELQSRTQGFAKVSGAFALVLLLVTVMASLWLFNRGSMALTIVLCCIALVAAVCASFWDRKEGRSVQAFFASSVTMAFSLGSALSLIFPYLFYATNDVSRSLMIANSSSSERTLGVMLIMALIGMPVVIGYTIFIYRIFRGKVRLSYD